MTEERMDLSDIARRAANRIVDEKHGAWGGVLLQVDSLLIPIIEDACRAWRDAARTEEHPGCDCGPSGHRYSDCPAYQAGLSEGVAQGRAERDAEIIAENHAIQRLTGNPREGYTLQQEIRAQLEEVGAERDALREALEKIKMAAGTCNEGETVINSWLVEVAGAALRATDGGKDK